MTSMATSNGAIRVLPAGKIPHPLGDPNRSHDEELLWRRGVVKRAVEALAVPLEEAKVFS